MADQDFNIKVVTTADTTGLKQTSAGLDDLKAKAASVSSAPVAGLTGSAVGIGTIITLLTGAINKWKEFDDGVTRAAESMIKAEEKMRELGESILDMQDRMIDAARLGAEPLQFSITRLQQKVIQLKTEMSLLDLPRQGEEWKKLAKDVALAESQLKGVTSELGKQTQAAEKLAQKNAEAAASFLKNAVASASPQTQAVLQNEQAARRARESGDEITADRLQKSADRFKASMTPEQREEYEGLTKPVRLGPKAGPGESQEAIDEIARNKINFDRQLKGQPPLPAGAAQGNDDLSQAIEQALGRVMSRYWGNP